MNKTRLVSMVALLAGAVLLALAAAPGHGPSMNLEGTWRSLDTSDGKGALAVITHIGGDSFQFSVFQAEPRFPGVARETPLVGTARRVGHGHYEFTFVKYQIADGDDRIAAVSVASGTADVEDDGTLTWTSVWSTYTPDQDPWAGDVPAFGCFGPYTGRYTRVEMLPPCDL